MFKSRQVLSALNFPLVALVIGVGGWCAAASDFRDTFDVLKTKLADKGTGTYFAIDKATGDAYYFGEDVDNYDGGGKVEGHEGSRLSGVEEKLCAPGVGLPEDGGFRLVRIEKPNLELD